jgi:hypothetical protein
LLKALVDTSGPEAYEAVTRLSRIPANRELRLRFRQLARGMAERDTDPEPWNPPDVHSFERRHIPPVKSAGDLYRVVLAVLDEITWGFANEDATSRPVLQTASNEDAVQEWLTEQLQLRAQGRYHVHRESEVAEGNLPDILVSATTASFQVAIEAKHGDNGCSARTLQEAIMDQLAEDYLKPPNRRHGVFVLTRHKKMSWRASDTGKLLDFAALIAGLAGVASQLKTNSVGSINVAVRGIDAAPRKRRRSRKK